MRKRSPKTRPKQLEALLQYVSDNKAVAKFTTRDKMPKNQVNTIWNNIASLINRTGYGPVKTGHQWRGIWSEWKTNVRRKSRQIELSGVTDNRGPQSGKRLTHLEERLLKFMSTIHESDKHLTDSGTTANKLEENGCKLSTVDSEENETDFVHTNEAIYEDHHTLETPFLTPKEECDVPLQSYSNDFSYVDEEHTQTLEQVAAKSGELSNSVAKLATAIDNYTKVETKKLKLAWLEKFGSLDGFDDF